MLQKLAEEEKENATSQGQGEKENEENEEHVEENIDPDASAKLIKNNLYMLIISLIYIKQVVVVSLNYAVVWVVLYYLLLVTH